MMTNWLHSQPLHARAALAFVNTKQQARKALNCYHPEAGTSKMYKTINKSWSWINEFSRWASTGVANGIGWRRRSPPWGPPHAERTHQSNNAAKWITKKGTCTLHSRADPRLTPQVRYAQVNAVKEALITPTSYDRLNSTLHETHSARLRKWTLTNQARCIYSQPWIIFSFLISSTKVFGWVSVLLLPPAGEFEPRGRARL